MSVPGQIAILLALTGRLCDERCRWNGCAMPSLRCAKLADGFPAELVKRITSVEELKDSDREVILQIARETLSPFQS